MPSGTKTSEVYSQKPTNGDGDFDFTRSTAATRIAANGNIEKETMNLLTYSNDFDNAAWTKTDCSVTPNTTANPIDGALTADTIVFNGANDQITQTFNVTNHTFSVYIKGTAGETIVVGFGAGAQIIHTLTGGFDRVSVFGSSNFFVFIGTFDGATARTIEVYGAQLEQGLVARDYIETTTTALYGGITDNVPRLDYTDSSCPALLLEPQRTNAITQSEYFASSDWIKTNSTITNNSVVSPEGLQNAATHTNTAASSVFLYQYVSASATTFTCSVFAKKNTNKYLGITMLYDSDTTKRYQVIFNLEDGTFAQQKDTASTLTNRDYDIEDYGNGWYRCSITSTVAASGRVYMVLQNSNIISSSFNANTLDWNDATIGSAYYFGAQAEAGSYATSYIPTYGTSVTRNADSCLGAGNASTFNSTEGVLYWEGSFDSTSTTAGAIALIGANSNRVQFYNSGSNVVALITPNGSTSFTATTSGSVDITSNHKYAVKWSLNDFALWVDGVKIATDTSGATFNNDALTELRFSDFGANYLYANVKQVLTFNTALSDAELATLTTI
jgi:hypothetical protein